MCIDTFYRAPNFADHKSIKAEFVISVDGASLGENQSRSLEDQKQVFLIRRRDDLTKVLIAREANILGPTRMVHSPGRPLPQSRTVAWVEADGPIMCKVDGVEGLVTLNPGMTLPNQPEVQPRQVNYRQHAKISSGRTSYHTMEVSYDEVERRMAAQLLKEFEETFPEVEEYLVKISDGERKPPKKIVYREPEPILVVDKTNDKKRRIFKEQTVQAMGLV